MTASRKLQEWASEADRQARIDKLKTKEQLRASQNSVYAQRTNASMKLGAPLSECTNSFVSIRHVCAQCENRVNRRVFQELPDRCYQDAEDKAGDNVGVRLVWNEKD